MKQILFILLLLCPFLSIAQDKAISTPPVSILHLRGGGHLLGQVNVRNTIVTEWVLLSGEIIKIPDHLIARIEKGNGRTSFFENGKKLVRSGYYGSFTLNPLFFFFVNNDIPSTLNSVLASYSNGYRFNPHLALGVGAGLAFPSDYLLLPTFLEVRGDMLKKATTPIYNLQMGYSFSINGDDIFWSKSKGGLFIQPSLGVKFHTKNKLSWLIRCGYTIQKETIEFRGWGGNSDEQTWTYRRLNLNFGIDF